MAARAAEALHEQGLLSAELLERVRGALAGGALAGGALAEGVPPAAAAPEPAPAPLPPAAALLAEGVIPFVHFVRLHLVDAAVPPERAVLQALGDVSATYLQGDVDAYKKTVDALGAQLMKSHAAVTSGDAGWFQQELTQMLDGLVRYYLGTSHWDDPDALLKANAQDDEEEQEQEVTVAAAAAASAMSRSWSRLKRSVWDNAVTNRLSTVREFSTMSEILRSVATEEASDALSEARRTLRESKPPFIVLLGGGMAAGKSTVVHRLKSDWEGSVVIEADEFKMKVTQRHLAPCFSAVFLQFFCRFSAVFPPFFCSFALSGFLAPRRREWAENGVTWGEMARTCSSASSTS